VELFDPNSVVDRADLQVTRPEIAIATA